MFFNVIFGLTGLSLIFGSLIVNHLRPAASRRFRDNVDAVGWMGLAMCVGAVGSQAVAEWLGFP